MVSRGAIRSDTRKRLEEATASFGQITHHLRVADQPVPHPEEGWDCMCGLLPGKHLLRQCHPDSEAPTDE